MPTPKRRDSRHALRLPTAAKAGLPYRKGRGHRLRGLGCPRNLSTCARGCEGNATVSESVRGRGLKRGERRGGGRICACAQIIGRRFPPPSLLPSEDNFLRLAPIMLVPGRRRNPASVPCHVTPAGASCAGKCPLWERFYPGHCESRHALRSPVVFVL